MKIDIMVVVGRNSVPYINFFKTLAEKMSSGLNDISWKCVTTVQCSDIPDGFHCVGHVKEENRKVMHGAGINLLAKKCSSEFGLVTHPDIAVLAKNWDSLMIEQMTEDVWVIGAVCEKTALQIKNVPSVFFSMFKREALKGIDFRPILTPQKRLLRKNGEKFDTGWHISRFISTANKKWINLDCKSAGRDECSLEYYNNEEIEKRVQSNVFAEYYLDNILIASHFGESRINPFSDRLSQDWQAAVLKYLGTENA